MDISVQTGGIIEFWGAEKGYQMIADAGFDGIDWNLDHAWNGAKVRSGILEHCIFEDSLEKITDYYQSELDAIEKSGLKITQAHAPFPAYVQNFPEFNDYAIQIYRQCIRFCDQLGIGHLVIHGISLAIGDDTQTRESIHQMNLHLYESLLPVIRQSGVMVCMENLFTHNGGQIVEGVCSNPEEAIQYIDYFNERAGKECFGLCLDTGHLNLLGKNQRTYINKVGSRIKALHLHDNWGQIDNHLAPYTGNIRWSDVLNGLEDIGYSGNLSFETFQQVSLKRVDPELVMLWLNTVRGIGEFFRKRLS